MGLLTREQFKEQVFKRDNNQCIICGSPAVDAHHIIDRSLFDDGGYYLNNGASLCSMHHIDAETTEISCAEIRERLKIETPILPDHFYLDEEYDKWGNILRPNGTRIAGELYHKDSVRSAIRKSGNLEKFVPYVKFPRTYHFPWSPNLHNDDRMLSSLHGLEGEEVVATIKMDGENTSMYRDYIHARSVDSKNHESRNWVKGLHGKIGYEIPDMWRVCGENLYAEHSIAYNKLTSYFQVFSIWDHHNTCLSWDDTVEWASLLGLDTVYAFYRGVFDKEAISAAFDDYCQGSMDDVEGYVVRVARSLQYGDYRHRVGKYVRKNHVQTDEFWMTKPVIKNEVQSEVL
jgi:hypothetical protein